jgi:thiol-disulfide isomerase/thioredoxin
MGKKLLLVVLVSAFTSGLLLTGCYRGNASVQSVAEGIAVDNPAPNFGLQSLDGQSVFLNQFRGRPVLLNFWTTWCPSCKAEMPLIQSVSADKTLATEGLAVLTVDLGEDLNTVESFKKSNNYSFTTLLDTRQIVGRLYNVWSIPTTYFIDKNGIIRNIRIGAFASESQIKSYLSKIIP